MTSDHHTWINLVNSKGSLVNIVCVWVCVCMTVRERESTYTQNMSQASDGKPEGRLVPNSFSIQNKQNNSTSQTLLLGMIQSYCL